MTDISYEHAVQTLRDRLGTRWDGGEAAGRDEMRQILEQELGYTRQQANDVITALSSSNTIRYVDDTSADQEQERTVSETAVPVHGGVLPFTPGTNSMPPVVPPGSGHWQIGADSATVISDVAGRAGQVKPPD